MTNLKLLAAVALCMAYAAGIATGWAGYTLAREDEAPPKGRGSWLSHTLGLDDDQKAKLEAIWSREDTEDKKDDPRARPRALYEARNAEVRSLLTPDQQDQFDAIYAAYDEKKEALWKERRKRHEDAVAATMKILTPEQQEKYRKIIEDFERKDARHKKSKGAWPKDK